MVRVRFLKEDGFICIILCVDCVISIKIILINFLVECKE